ncbi:adenylate/guanylate cyclase domain-containing protein [Paenibacillus thermotolerans]|uniref:adenylate/guanylate cyclase domain-containing protein n=1 Tax=Paenibacillus thermotolerans TaxID=3027807 RepID=UPI00236828DB|nr:MULTISPECIES: adenylate/guanylate cyclase domain-containing protein [unclassified Paenibacillus]
MNERLLEAYRRFVPEQFLNYMRKNAISDVKLGDHVKADMTVLFSDIRSFTTLSERLTPEQNFRFLNSYLSKMEPSVHRFGGFIDKFIGDSIMALFGQNVDNAVLSALDMIERLQEYNLGRLRAGYEPIRIGIGLNSGPLMLGIVGGDGRMDVTVIGDAVNLASRIEGLNKRYGTTLLVSGNTAARLSDPSKYGMRKIDSVRVRGRRHIETIYECFDRDPPDIYDKKLMTRPAFEQALMKYELGSYDEAKELFRDVFAQNRYDLVSRWYIERCAAPPAEDVEHIPLPASSDLTHDPDRLTRLLVPKNRKQDVTKVAEVRSKPALTPPPFTARFAETAVIYFEHHLQLTPGHTSLDWNWEPEFKLRDISACIFFRGTAEMESAMLCSVDLPVGLSLLRRMSYEDWSAQEEIPLLLDGLGEALNFISGNAMKMFEQYSDFVTIDPPISARTHETILIPNGGVWNCTLIYNGEPIILLAFEQF